ncbi:hypothetical protein BDD12DRAFT_553551 [Trichophaea hybrida]|nr:hypothetical protein BDD12DRAFT_553551 [Trichophaea hybrida]
MQILVLKLLSILTKHHEPPSITAAGADGELKHIDRLQPSAFMNDGPSCCDLFRAQELLQRDFAITVTPWEWRTGRACTQSAACTRVVLMSLGLDGVLAQDGRVLICSIAYRLGLFSMRHPHFSAFAAADNAPSLATKTILQYRSLSSWNPPFLIQLILDLPARAFPSCLFGMVQVLCSRGFGSLASVVISSALTKIPTPSYALPT